jgi:polysaccharide deacetylase family protein (PEP-CTERM system associated)
MEHPRIVNALTVDVEDYFHVSAFDRAVARADWCIFERRVVANTSRLLDLFAEHDVRATFFVLGWVAEREPALVRRVAAAGHEIASHGFGHRLVYDQSPAEFRDDVRRARAVLQAVSGQPVMGYRAPSFSITERSLWALEILAEEGFVYDASVFPIRHDRYGVPSAPRHPFRVHRGSAGFGGTGVPPVNGVGFGRTGVAPAEGVTAVEQGFSPALSLLEIPASTIRLAGTNLPIAGGGYFRLLPYAWTRWGIRRLNELEGKPAVFYLHPWEIDPEQPRLRASPLSRLRHYHNLADTESRLRQLLKDFSFAPIAEAILAPAVAAA